MCKDFLSAISNLNFKIREALYHIRDEIKKNTQEICIKVNKPLIIFTNNKSFFISKDGKLSYKADESLIVTQEDIFETIKILYNLSSINDQIKNGFITLKGGHRAGLCGKATLNDGKIINVFDVSSINLRISREIKGCSDPIFDVLGTNIENTIIIGAPSSGKTTVLRDISRRISTTMLNGRLMKTVIVDERGEVASIYNGIPQKDIGFCDVLSNFPKNEGISRAIRTLSPQIIICDEIGSDEDLNIINESLSCGVKMIFSMHANNLDEISKSFRIKNILSSGLLKNLVLLNDRSNPGTIKNIFKIELN